MSSRNITFSEDEYYHCYSRGVEKRVIFSSPADYQRFTELLFASNSTSRIHVSDFLKHNRGQVFSIERPDTLVHIGAYVLMPNHFHILVREKQKGGLSLFMQKLVTGYTMYFNKKYERSGALFGSRFKAEHLSSDNYLKYIFSYIHLNPVKLIDGEWKTRGVRDVDKTQSFLSKYLYSSYPDYIGKLRKESAILEQGAFPLYFKNEGDFLAEICEWLSYVKVRP